VFQDFFISGGGGGSAFYAVAKKCSGGKLGYYKLVNRASTVISSGELHYELHADMPVFAKFRQMRDVNFTATSSFQYPPGFLEEIIRAYSEFYENMFVRYAAKKDKLIFRHQGLVLFGQESFPPGEKATAFKPKPKC
jgi:hypothetical protein